MKVKIGYYAQTEAYPPSQLADFCKLAEDCGFDEVWAADHFHPWAHTGTSASFCWILLTAAAERTRRISLGTGVTAPILRYNPAIVAQAFSTLGNMYPGRFFLGLGTGEAMNEVPLGYDWPNTPERIARVEEAIKIIRLLWEGEFVSFKGRFYALKKANLYTKPLKPVPIYVAANGPKMAALAGKHADGILTIDSPPDHVLNTLFPAVERGARSVGKDPKSIYKVIETVCAYDKDYDTAIEACRKWGATAVPFFYQMNVHDPREIEALGKLVDREVLAKTWLISSNPEDHIKKIESYLKLGFQGVHVVNAASDEEGFIRMYGRHVIPYIKDMYSKS